MENMLIPKEAARYLTKRGYPHTMNTLAVYRHHKIGPRFIKIGNTPVYTKEELDAYMKARMDGVLVKEMPHE